MNMSLNAANLKAPFPWFSILGPAGTHPCTRTQPGFGEALIVLTSTSQLRKYRVDNHVISPAVVFENMQQLDWYLHSGFGIAGVLLNPDTNDQATVTSQKIHASCTGLSGGNSQA